MERGRAVAHEGLRRDDTRGADAGEAVDPGDRSRATAPPNAAAASRLEGPGARRAWARARFARDRRRSRAARVSQPRGYAAQARADPRRLWLDGRICARDAAVHARGSRRGP